MLEEMRVIRIVGRVSLVRELEGILEWHEVFSRNATSIAPAVMRHVSFGKSAVWFLRTSWDWPGDRMPIT